MVFSPLLNFPYRGDNVVCGPSSVLGSSYRSCGHMVLSQAHRTTFVKNGHETINWLKTF